jgi:hypothetical protein
VRELLGFGSENEVPIEFAENPKVPKTATSTTSGADSNAMDFKLGSNVDRENVNEDERRGVGVQAEKMGQDVEDCNLEFSIIERQL